MVYSLRNCLLSLPDRLNSSFCPLLLPFCFVEEHPDKVGSVSYSRLEIATINIICFIFRCFLFLHSYLSFPRFPLQGTGNKKGNMTKRPLKSPYLYLLPVFYLFFYFLVTFVTYKRKPSKINTFTG